MSFAPGLPWSTAPLPFYGPNLLSRGQTQELKRLHAFFVDKSWRTNSCNFNLLPLSLKTVCFEVYYLFGPKRLESEKHRGIQDSSHVSKNMQGAWPVQVADPAAAENGPFGWKPGPRPLAEQCELVKSIAVIFRPDNSWNVMRRCSKTMNISLPKRPTDSCHLAQSAV